ncbi:uncharacterized protein LOC144914705 isoform X3 [Branchiostoma floridae x Branchiostoma belcheri]
MTATDRGARWAVLVVLLFLVLGTSSSSAGCPDGFTKFGGACFKVYQQTASYNQARQFCVNKGGLLAMPKDEKTDDFLWRLKNAVDSGSYFWFGLSDENREGQWRWEDGAILNKSADWTNWRPGQPDNHNGKEDCAHYQSVPKTGWNDLPCSYKTAKFICQTTDDAAAVLPRTTMTSLVTTQTGTSASHGHSGDLKKITLPVPRSANNYARLMTTLPQDLTSFTLCLHMRTDMGSNTDASLFSYAVGSGVHANELLLYKDRLRRGHFQLYIQNIHAELGDLPVWDSEWHAICATWRSGDGAWQVYTDGVLQATGSRLNVGGKVRRGGTWILAQDQDTVTGGFTESQAFCGELTQVNLWDRVLSADEIGTNWSVFCNYHGNVIDWATTNVTVSGQASSDLYRCVERPRSSMVSSVTEQIKTSTSQGSPVVPGDSQKIIFPGPRGIDDYARMETTLSEDLTSFTLCVHMRSNMDSNWNDISLVSYAVSQHNNELLLFLKDGFKLFIQSGIQMAHPPVWDGEWHTVCTTWRSSDGAWQLYADGVLTDSGSGFNVGGSVRTGGTWILGQDQDVVGGRFEAHQSFIGELSEVNLWDRVLSPAEIAADCSYHGNVIDWDTTNITVFGQASRAEYQCERPRSSMVSSVTEQIETSTSQGSPACPKDYQLFQGICYKAFNFAATFEQSVIRCVKDGGTLAMPRDQKTNEFLYTLKNAVDQKSPFRFGLHDILKENVWRWMDGQELGDFTNWAPGEPNNSGVGPGEDCVEYYPRQWNDKECHDARKFICQVDTTENGGYIPYPSQPDVFFKLFAELKTYEAAKQTCLSNGGHLADVKTQELHDFLLSEIQKVDASRDYWIGLNDLKDEKTWTWSDGTPVSDCVFTNWAPGEPNNAYGQGQDCGHLWKGKGFKWDDDGCGKQKYFICQIGSGEEKSCRRSVACPKDYQLFQGICYKAFNFAATFHQSISWCVKDGGTLAMPRDQKTNEFLVGLKNSVDQRKPFRFGLHDIPEENVWRWMDGQELGDFTDWAPEEPNNSGSGEDCVEYWPQTQKKRTTNKWNDRSCFYKEKFICQVDTTERHGYIPYTDVYFKVFAQLKTYEAAKQTCLSNGGHLADVKTQELRDFLLSEIQKVDASRDYWIGLNDLKVENTWTWSDGTPVSDCVFTNWAPGEPNNNAGADGRGQDCGHLWKAKGFKWDDDGCGIQKYFICQIGFGDESSCRRSEGKPTDVGMQSTLELFYTADCPEDYQLFQGICYKAFNFAADFQQSVIRCVKDGGTLAMPRDQKTNEFLVGLKKLVDQKSPFRFGLHDILDENIWRWMDGQELGNFTDWGPGEPNDAKRGPGEDCVEYLPYHKDKWNDVACQEKRKFICQVDTSESVLVSGSIDAGVRYEGRAVLESPVFSTNCSNSTLVFHYEMQGSTVVPAATLYVSIVDNESNSDSELLGTIPFKLTHGQTNRVQMDFHRKQPFRVVFTAELDHSANSAGRVGQIHLFDVMVVNGKACRPAGPILPNSEEPVPSKEPVLSEGPAVSKGAIIGTIVGLVIVAVAIAAGVTVARRMKGERFCTAATSTTVLMNLENVMFEPSMDDED